MNAPNPCLTPPCSRAELEEVYTRYNHREFIHPDPLEFLYHYDDLLDREVVGMVASSLAYGRVRQILRSVSCALGLMGPSPHRFLMDNSPEHLREVFVGFKHRFTTGEHFAALLAGLKEILHRYGSLQACFLSGLRERDTDTLEALDAFVQELHAGMGGESRMLVPLPSKGSACKRLNLFLRWMVRRDEVDPGGWEGVLPRRLIVPLDTHMHRIGLAMGLTRRKQADGHTAREITEAFRSIVPEDPVRYDFALTRSGIRGTLDQ